jgi:hypothetical protein
MKTTMWYILLLALVCVAQCSYSNNLQIPSPATYQIDSNGDDVQICFSGFVYSQHVTAGTCTGGSGYGDMIMDSNSLEWEVLLGGDIWVYSTGASLKLKDGSSTIYTLSLTEGLNAPNRVQIIPFQTWSSGTTLSLWASGSANTLFNFTTHYVGTTLVTTRVWWISLTN